LVRRKINRKYLKVRTNKSNTRLTGQQRCPFYAAIGQVKQTQSTRKRSPDAVQRHKRVHVPYALGAALRPGNGSSESRID
jgi:hypothetical protein